MGKFEQERETRRPVLNTVLKGGTSLKTPLPGFNGIAQPTVRGAVATIIRRDGPGTNAVKMLLDFPLLISLDKF